VSGSRNDRGDRRLRAFGERPIGDGPISGGGSGRGGCRLRGRSDLQNRSGGRVDLIDRSKRRRWTEKDIILVLIFVPSEAALIIIIIHLLFNILQLESERETEPERLQPTFLHVSCGTLRVKRGESKAALHGWENRPYRDDRAVKGAGCAQQVHLAGRLGFLQFGCHLLLLLEQASDLLLEPGLPLQKTVVFGLQVTETLLQATPLHLH